MVNRFIWLQAIAIGGGMEYAYWVTIPWAIGLAIHALAYISNRGKEERLPEDTPWMRPQRNSNTTESWLVRSSRLHGPAADPWSEIRWAGTHSSRCPSTMSSNVT